MRIRQLATAAALAIAITACSSSPDKAANADSTTTTTSSAAATATPDITITAFAPSGQNISVDFQIDGDGFRFEWAKFVLTGPDGTTYTAYRDDASAPYEIANGTLVNGGLFQTDGYKPGKWSIAYDGTVLQEKTL